MSSHYFISYKSHPPITAVQPQKFKHAASFDMMATFAYINSITAIIVYDWHIFCSYIYLS